MLEEQYNKCFKTKSDINEHIPTLYKYAKECTSVTEFGTRACISTIGFLNGFITDSLCVLKWEILRALKNN